MNSTLMKLANFCAKNSVSKWNSNCFLRLLCRKGYQALGELCINAHAARAERGSCQNTYPWPYVCEEFANWPEEADVALGYTLICDPAGFVIRRSPSYIALKMRELHGKWPKLPDGWHPHAKEWRQYLRRLGYGYRDVWSTTQIINYYTILFPNLSAMQRLKLLPYFVGVNPHYGEFGQLYWLENVIEDDTGSVTVRSIVATTYEDFKFQIVNLREGDDVTWVKVS